MKCSIAASSIALVLLSACTQPSAPISGASQEAPPSTQPAAPSPTPTALASLEAQQADAPTPSPSPSLSAPPAAGVEFANLNLLRMAVDAAGVPCVGDNWNKIADNAGGTCGEYTVVMWYPDQPGWQEFRQETIDLALLAIEQGGARDWMGVLAGPNWTIRGSLDDFELLRAHMGGEVHTA